MFCITHFYNSTFYKIRKIIIFIFMRTFWYSSSFRLKPYFTLCSTCFITTAALQVDSYDFLPEDKYENLNVAQALNFFRFFEKVSSWSQIIFELIWWPSTTIKRICIYIYVFKYPNTVRAKMHMKGIIIQHFALTIEKTK